MTNHIDIEFTALKVHFKVTYRNNKFRKVEHLRGALKADLLSTFSRVIPYHFDSVGKYQQTYNGRVNYTIIEKEQSLFSLFNSEWHLFYENFAEMPPKFTATDGKSLKGIISHFKHISTTDAEALELWKLMLDKWDTLSEFHQKNTDLKYINSKLNILLNEIKRKNDTQRDVKSASSSEVGKQFKFN